MKFAVDTKLKNIRGVEALFVPVWLGKTSRFGEIFAELAKTDQEFLKDLLKKRPLKAGENRAFRFKHPELIFVAAEEAFTEHKLALHIRKYMRTAKAEGLKTVGMYIDDFTRDKISTERMAGLVVGNSEYAHYEFSETYKTPPKDGWKRVETVRLYTYNESKKLREIIESVETVIGAINQCRALCNMPPSDINPEAMVEAARTATKGIKNLKFTAWDEKKLKQQGMNAILAVGKGSASPPRFIILEYMGGKASDKPIALVGKGVTFDSGGLNIKPGESMADMHMDMSGGASVIYGIAAIAKLKLPVNVIGLIPCVENMPSGFSYRQGDIIKTYGGKTIEVANTDAEGRVILSDAIEYAKTKKPALIVTLATLTGAAVSALGEHFAGLFVKGNKPLQDAFVKIGEETGEALWPLPLTDAFEKEVEGRVADVLNTNNRGTRWGGASHGAAFLSHFAKPEHFVHIDMAPRMTALDTEQLGKGAVGFGVRIFIRLAEHWSELKKLLT